MDELRKIIAELKSSMVKPDYKIFIYLMGRTTSYREVQEIYNELQLLGLKPNKRIYSILLHLTENFQEAQTIMAELEQKKYKNLDSEFYIALVSKTETIEEGRALIKELNRKGLKLQEGILKYRNIQKEARKELRQNLRYSCPNLPLDTLMEIPELEPVQRSREFQAHDESTRSKVVFEYLFNSKTHRWLDENVIGLNPSESRGYQAMGILHHIGLKDKHKGIFNGCDVQEAIRVLHQQQNDFGMVIRCLEQFNNEEAQKLNFNEFDYDLFEKRLHNQEYHIGKNTKYYIITVKIDSKAVSPILSKYLVLLLENNNVVKQTEVQSEITKQLLTTAKKEGIKLLHQQNPIVKLEEVTMVHYKQGRNNSNDWQKDSKDVLVDLFKEYQASFSSTILKTSVDDVDSELSEEEAYHKDGATSYYYGKRYERNPQNRAKAIEIHGLNCAGCGFNFEKVYGERGKDFIEIHHIKPLSTIQEEIVINPETDLVPACSNCHRMIHRRKDEVLTIEELRELIKSNIADDTL